MDNPDLIRHADAGAAVEPGKPAAWPMRVWFEQSGKDRRWSREGWTGKLYRPYQATE